MTLSDLPFPLQEAFKRGDIEVKVISVAPADFEVRLEAALMDGWSAVSVRADSTKAHAMLVRSTENKTEE